MNYFWAHCGKSQRPMDADSSVIGICYFDNIESPIRWSEHFSTMSCTARFNKVIAFIVPKVIVLAALSRWPPDCGA